MKKLVYIFVPLILLSSLMPTINYSTPASTLEIILESPEASEFELIESRAVMAKRLQAYGITGFEITLSKEKKQLTVILPDETAHEPILPLLVERGELLFYATFSREEVARMLADSPYRQQWRRWLTVDAGNLGNQGNSALLAELELQEVTAFNEFVAGLGHMEGLPPYLHFAFGGFLNEDHQVGVYALKSNHDTRILLTGEAVKDARAQANESTGGVSILLEFHPEGKDAWAKATRENTERSIAVVIDDLVYFAPRVIDEIKEGKVQITGDFTMQEAKTLAAIVQGGVLPVTFELQ
jgi:hypothetical protein